MFEYKIVKTKDDIVCEIIEFRFYKLPYNLTKLQYKILNSAGYGYKISQSQNNNKCAILTPQNKQLTKYIFDDIIGFHHSTNNYNVIHAIGFIKDRVYAIYKDGTIQILHYSKEEYLNKKHRYDESIKHIKYLLNESLLNKIIRDTIKKYLLI